jgi:hypothetical protein
MRKSVVVVLPLALLRSMFADGFFYSAYAQCASTDKIYIDPRISKRPNISREAFQAIMLDSTLSPEAKNMILQQVMQQGQPIVVPYGTGKVQ